MNIFFHNLYVQIKIYLSFACHHNDRAYKPVYALETRPANTISKRCGFESMGTINFSILSFYFPMNE